MTIAKLATRLALRGERVSVITTDTDRAGGIEQLAAFTRLLKVDLLEVEDPGALADAISVQRDAHQVLIDTAGQNPFDPHALGQLGRMIMQTKAEAVLVLPAGIDAKEAGEIAAAFQAAGATRLLQPVSTFPAVWAVCFRRRGTDGFDSVTRLPHLL